MQTADAPNNTPFTDPDSARRSVTWDIELGSRNYMALLTSQLATSASAFAATWVATRALGPAGYGVAVSVIVASQFAYQLAIHWTAISLSRYGCEEFVSSGRIASCFWGRLLVAVPNLIVVVVTAPWWLPPVAAWLHIPIFLRPLILVHLLVTTLWIHMQQALQAAKLPRLQGRLIAWERAQALIFIGVLAVMKTLTPFWLILSYVIAQLPVCLCAVFRLRRLVYPGIHTDRPVLKQMLVFSLPLIPSSMVGYFSTSYLDAFFIMRYLTPSALGIYVVTYQLTGTIMQLPLLAGYLILPLLITAQSAGEEQRVSRIMQTVIPTVSLMWSLVCVLIAGCGHYLVLLLFGPRFALSADLVWPMMATVGIAGPVLMGYFPISNAKSMSYVTMINATTCAVVNIGLNSLLIPRYGLIGCAWATTIANCTALIVTITIVDKRLPAGKTWAFHAILPVLVASGCEAVEPHSLVPYAAAIGVTALLGYIHRNDIKQGCVALIRIVKRRGP